MIAVPGPIPKHSSELSRDRDADRAHRVPLTKGERKPVSFRPEADPNWHQIAIWLYDSLANSGQSDFYQESDWVFAYSVCDDLSKMKFKSNRSAMMVSAIYNVCDRLLITEGDRRRLRIDRQQLFAPKIGHEMRGM